MRPGAKGEREVYERAGWGGSSAVRVAGCSSRGVARPERRPTRRMAGRTDARRHRRSAGVAGASDGAALGTPGVAGRRRRRARRHFQALGSTPDRRQLAPRVPRGRRHPAPEPRGRDAARPGRSPRPQDRGPGHAPGRRLGHAGHERPFGRRSASGRRDAVHARGRGRLLRRAGLPVGAGAGVRATRDLGPGLAGNLRRDGPRPGCLAGLRPDGARSGARGVGGDAPAAAGGGCWARSSWASGWRNSA